MTRHFYKFYIVISEVFLFTFLDIFFIQQKVLNLFILRLLVQVVLAPLGQDIPVIKWMVSWDRRH